MTPFKEKKRKKEKEKVTDPNISKLLTQFTKSYDPICKCKGRTGNPEAHMKAMNL